jgi:heme o synthase
MIKAYYYLTKPGIIYGNWLSVIAGFFLASTDGFDPLLFLATLLGIGFVIGSACVFNNYIDRDIDEKMLRTKKRALVTKKIPVKHALIFGIILGLLGFVILTVYVNVLTAFIGYFGFFFYVVMYGVWKRVSLYGTLIGSVSGAIPPVVGYTAITNNVDATALILFLILVIWQMPHFYAIAIFRQNDYEAAGIPVLPIKKGRLHTKIHMLCYIVAFIIAANLFTVIGLTGYTYTTIMTVLGLGWLALCIKGFRKTNDERWARKMFGFSLIVLTVWCVLLTLTLVLP